MNEALKVFTKKKVWNKLTMISEDVYRGHIAKLKDDPNYPVLTINMEEGYFAYHVNHPPDFRLLESIVKNKYK
jgi:hypothetical protein